MKTDSIVKSVIATFNQEYPEYKELFKEERTFSNESSFENIFFRNERGTLDRMDKDILQSKLSEILRDMDIYEINRQKAIIQSVLASYTKPASSFDINTESFFVLKNTVVDLEYLSGKHYQTIDELLNDKKQWLHSLQEYKENLFTKYSMIDLPDDVSVDVFTNSIIKIRNTFLKSMGEKEDSVDCFFDYLAAALSGSRFADYIVCLQGAGGTGKTVLVNYCKYIFGLYFQSLDANDFLAEKPNIRQKLYYSRKARIISLSEPSDSKKKVSLLKKVSGKTNIEIEGKEFSMNSLFLLDTNFPISTDNFDSGLERRLYILPFGPQIPESEQNRNLLNELKEIAPFFLLELLRRFSCLDLTRIHAPEITPSVLYWNALIQNKDTVTAFAKIMCTASAEEGKEFTLKEIHEIYDTHFLPVFSQYIKRNLFWIDNNVEKQFSFSQTPQSFNSIFSKYFRNCGCKNGYKTIRHLIIGIPEGFNTMEEHQIQELVKRFHYSEEHARLIIDKAKGPSSIKPSMDPYENDCRDLWAYNGPWNMNQFQAPTAEAWKHSVIDCLMQNPNNIDSFRSQFVINIMELSQGINLCSIISNKLQEYKDFKDEIFSDSELVDVMDQIFDAFAKWFRNDLKSKKQRSFTDPRNQLSQYNTGINQNQIPSPMFPTGMIMK